MSALLVGGILDVGKTLIGKLFPDPEQRAKAELELLTMQQNGELEAAKVQMSAIIAEAQSADPFTSRSRPSFLYVFYFLLLCLVVIAPFLGVFFPEQMELFFDNVAKGFAAIPEELWWTFTVGYLGYTGARTYEKRVAKKR
jgi:hypothetical protein